jgi:hypothetical protein
MYVPKRVRWAVVEMRVGPSAGSCLSAFVIAVEDGFKLAWSRLLTLLLPISAFVYPAVKEQRGKWKERESAL